MPALCQAGFVCLSSADNEQDIHAAATHAIADALHYLREASHPLHHISDQGADHYRTQQQYAHCHQWIELEYHYQQEDIKQATTEADAGDFTADKQVKSHCRKWSGQQ